MQQQTQLAFRALVLMYVWDAPVTAGDCGMTAEEFAVALDVMRRDWGLELYRAPVH